MSSATASRPVSAPFNVKTLLDDRRKQLGIAERLLARREKVVVTFTESHKALGEIDGQLEVILGQKLPSPLNGESTAPVVSAPTVPAAVQPKPQSKAPPVLQSGEQSPLHSYLEQAIMDKGPLTISELAAEVTAAGYKSTAKDFKAVVAQTVDVDSKKKTGARFRISGKKQKRGNKWELTAMGKKETAQAPAAPLFQSAAAVTPAPAQQ